MRISDWSDVCSSDLQSGATTDQSSGKQGPYSDAGPLADKLRPLELSPSVAGQLGDRNFLLTQGTMIDCTLQTKLVSTQAGLQLGSASCRGRVGTMCRSRWSPLQ